MEQRRLGKTGRRVSAIGFGGWAIGGTWGKVSDDDAMAALRAAADAGVDFYDTADVYGDGRSERLIGALLKERPGDGLMVATKAGRRLDPHVAAGYTSSNLERFVDRSLQMIGVEALDLVQLHSPPPEVFYRPEVFAAMDDLVASGKIRGYGVSVEKVEEGLKALEFEGVATIQIIYNMFRQRPAERLFADAEQRDVGIIVRVPLASGLLSGKMSSSTRFEADDHRNFNRSGESFDVGETFAGVPFAVGLQAVEELRTLVPDGWTMAQLALRWVLMQSAVSTVIPGARNAQQAAMNAAAADLPGLGADVMERVASVYDEYVKPMVHQRW